MAMSDTTRGVVLMNVAMLSFTLNDTAMKVAAETVPLFQATTLRGALATAGLVGLARLRGKLRLWPGRRDGGLVALRTLAEVVATLTFLLALTQMPLANLSAIMQSLPLAVTLVAALVLRDPIGWRRLSAIAMGFLGVLLIVRPGTEGFDRWALLGLASVACVVVRDLSTRVLGRGVPSATVAIWAGAGVTLMGLAGMAVQGWAPMGLPETLIIVFAAACLVVGYMTVVMVMRVGDIGTIAPFRYTALLWAIMLGYAVFGALPDRLTLLGAAVVVASGIYTLLRERSLRRQGH